MNQTDAILYLLTVASVLCPALLLVLIGLPAFFERPLSERHTALATNLLVLVGFLCTVGIAITMLATGSRFLSVELGNWFQIPEEHFQFQFALQLDVLSVTFAILSFMLCGVISAFTSKYLHREPGYQRFFVLFALFLLGMTLASLSATIETLFAGWELVGLSSALLVAFFHERVQPVRNGLRVWSVYRLADAAFLLAAILIHHRAGEGEFDAFLGHGSWPTGVTTFTGSSSFFIGLLFLVAAAGKSALVPFSGWLPRAMEGPTSSSAVFYGALSVHLGAFLLLRMSPVLNASPLLSGMVFLLGLSTAILAALSQRVQSDIKSALAYASLTQVGLIVAEIGLGLRYWALAHLVGHACLRTLQLLRAPMVLQDYQNIDNALGSHVTRGSPTLSPGLPRNWNLKLYQLSLDRWHLDAMLEQYVTRPFLAVFRHLDQWEQRITNRIDHAEISEMNGLHETDYSRIEGDQ